MFYLNTSSKTRNYKILQTIDTTFKVMSIAYLIIKLIRAIV